MKIRTHTRKRQNLVRENLYQWFLCSNEYINALSHRNKEHARFYRDYLIRFSKWKWAPIPYTRGYEISVILHPMSVK